MINILTEVHLDECEVLWPGEEDWVVVPYWVVGDLLATGLTEAPGGVKDPEMEVDIPVLLRGNPDSMLFSVTPDDFGMRLENGDELFLWPEDEFMTTRIRARKVLH